jgi:hypothetical protein
VTYPCPVCQAPADLQNGCSGCGRAPDRDAAEVVRLNGELAELAPRVEETRLAYTALAGRLRETRQRRDDLAAGVRIAAFRARGVQLEPAPAATVPPAPVPPEATPRTVQNLLFVLGGLLVGAAAIVFAGVAWATYGQTGRAVILAATTLLTLAVPPLVDRRGLRATAETFTAVGMLLVLLDGYAAWYVDFLGVGSLPGFGYAALVCAVTAAVGAVYATTTKLVAARVAAVVAAQPVMPLIAAEVGVDAAGWAYAFAAVAAADLALAWKTRWVTRVFAWIGYGFALLVSILCALTALLEPGAAAPVATVGVPAVMAALLLVAGGTVARLVPLRFGGALAVVLALGAAVLRPVAQARWSYLLVAAAAVVLALALLASVAGRHLPATERLGARWGAGLAAGVLATVVTVLVLGVAAATVVGLGDDPFDWQLPVAAAAVWPALAAVLPARWRIPAALVGATSAVLALPAAVPLDPWALSTVDLVAAAAIVLVRRLPAARAVAAGVLVVHAVLVSLGDPPLAAAVLFATVLLALTSAIVYVGTPQKARSGASEPPHLRDGGGVVAGGVSLAVAYLAWPAAAAQATVAAGFGGPVPARVALAAAAVLLVALLAVRTWLPAGRTYAIRALAAATVAAGAWPELAGQVPPTGLDPALALVLLAVLAVTLTLTPPISRFSPPQNGAAGSRNLQDRRMTGLAGVPLLGLVAVSGVPAAAAVLVRPYAWAGHVWAGAPGTGPGVAGATAAAFLLTALAASIAFGGRRRIALAAALPFAATGTLAALAAAGAPWPAVPAVALAAGVALGLAGARRTTAWWLLVPLGALLAGSGTAGLLPTEASTLAGLGVLTAAGAVAGTIATSTVGRATGWAEAVAAAGAFAVAASAAADLPLARAAYPLVGVAALALALGALLRRRPVEGRAVDVAAFAAAVLALMLTVTEARHAAAVCTLWGAAVAARAVLPGEKARIALAVVAAITELAAWWILLASEQVAVPEAYTLPAAALALVAGHLALRTRPGLGSWAGYGPGLAAALLPSLASVLVAGDQGARRLLLGAGALAVVLAGAALRRQAAVVVAGGTLVALAGHEIVVWDRLPRWAYLALGGLILIAVAMTYERRLRDLQRLRGAIARMS